MGSDRIQLERLVATANRARRAGDVADPAVVAALAVLGDPVSPDRRLVAYGTLRPGAVNEHVLAGARGTWMPATVTGELGTWRGYPILRPARAGEAIAVMVLESADLPGLWPHLDRFEGPAYRREWIVYERDGGACGTGSCYVEA
jgi:gamma-glutamylcyclotransferase (GGCT)/AIG2-like uncharacterized protein YtfP